MKAIFHVTSITLAVLCARATAGTATMYMPTYTGTESFSLYNKLGVPVANGEASLTLTASQQIDTDEDGILDFWSLQFSVSTTGGLYSIAMTDGNFPSSTSWSGLYSFGQHVELDGTSGWTPPIDVGASPLAINGMLDVYGNIMQFGTLGPNPLDDGTPPGVRFTLNPYTMVYDTAMPRALAPNFTDPARMTWSFPPSVSAGLNPLMIPRMVLSSDGTLALRTDTGGEITINPNTGTINIGVNTVLTSNQLATGAIAPSFLSLKLGGASSAANGSLAAGIQSSATGQYSYALGINSSANSYGMAAFGRYNNISSGQNTINWVATDDLFVIGNGASSSSRSNALTIRKNGATGFGSGALSGTAFAGLGGVDIAFGGVPATLLLGADENLTTRSNSTVKTARVGTPHYSTADEAVASFVMFNSDSSNYLGIGGGTGVLNALTDIEFRTAPDVSTLTGTTRLSIDRSGNIVVGTTNVPTGSTQVVLGTYNQAKTGSLVVGSGTGSGPADRKNALRVTTEGNVLIKPSGDIDMGEFTAGEQP